MAWRSLVTVVVSSKRELVPWRGKGDMGVFAHTSFLYFNP